MDDWKLKVRTVVKPRECYFPSLNGQLITTLAIFRLCVRVISYI